MAWQPYVAELMKNGNLNHAAILGKADALVWASDPAFKLSSYEADVNIDVDNVKKEHINEQATLLERRLNFYTSLQEQGFSYQQGWCQNQWCQVCRQQV
jgi:hypothetical protein